MMTILERPKWLTVGLKGQEGGRIFSELVVVVIVLFEIMGGDSAMACCKEFRLVAARISRTFMNLPIFRGIASIEAPWMTVFPVRETS
jgi:hypothetical protein